MHPIPYNPLYHGTQTSSARSLSPSSISLVTIQRTVSERSRRYVRSGPHTRSSTAPDGSSALVEISGVKVEINDVIVEISDIIIEINDVIVETSDIMVVINDVIVDISDDIVEISRRHSRDK